MPTGLRDARNTELHLVNVLQHARGVACWFPRSMCSSMVQRVATKGGGVGIPSLVALGMSRAVDRAQAARGEAQGTQEKECRVRSTCPCALCKRAHIRCPRPSWSTSNHTTARAERMAFRSRCLLGIMCTGRVAGRLEGWGRGSAMRCTTRCTRRRERPCSRYDLAPPSGARSLPAREVSPAHGQRTRY